MIIKGVAKLCENFLSAFESAMEAVVNAAVDRVVRAWVEEGHR